ncbi:hypothetical protein WJX74_010098 [Apatococcus lobatus]|uniref:Palmitoyl-protein thioesterase 1 n=1 Tax=Apatococcus lobatus TaxID=904363 RepID=A0AAW1RBT4_9CHLO
MGDSCCASFSIGAIQKAIEEALPGTFVHSIATGSSMADDTFSGFYGSVNAQVGEACKIIASKPELQSGYNAIGFSQGGQFLRAVAERCNHNGPRMAKLVTLGSQHQGIMNVPECWNPSYNKTPAFPYCAGMQTLLGFGAYLPWIRSHLVQAQYFKDPYRLPAYLRHSPFLPDINNERPAKNETYRENLAGLEQLVLFRFANDVTVVPRDSAWFSFFNGQELVALKDQPIYQEDWIGLRALDNAGRLVFDEIPGGHMHFTLSWFQSNIIAPYLGGSADLNLVQAVNHTRWSR